MDLKKIYKFIIDERMANIKLRLGFYNNEILVSSDAVGFLIPKDDFIFSADMLTDKEFYTDEVLSEIFNAKESVDALVTSEIKWLGKTELIAIKGLSNNKTVYVNRKLLKLFNKIVHFKINTDTNLVLVYENEKLVGFITPIRTDVLR